jgi:hypothetical protein
MRIPRAMRMACCFVRYRAQMWTTVDCFRHAVGMLLTDLGPSQGRCRRTAPRASAARRGDTVSLMNMTALCSDGTCTTLRNQHTVSKDHNGFYEFVVGPAVHFYESNVGCTNLFWRNTHSTGLGDFFDLTRPNSLTTSRLPSMPGAIAAALEARRR